MHDGQSVEGTQTGRAVSGRSSSPKTPKTLIMQPHKSRMQMHSCSTMQMHSCSTMQNKVVNLGKSREGRGERTNEKHQSSSSHGLECSAQCPPIQRPTAASPLLTPPLVRETADTRQYGHKFRPMRCLPSKSSQAPRCYCATSLHWIHSSHRLPEHRDGPP